VKKLIIVTMAAPCICMYAWQIICFTGVFFSSFQNALLEGQRSELNKKKPCHTFGSEPDLKGLLKFGFPSPYNARPKAGYFCVVSWQHHDLIYFFNVLSYVILEVILWN